MSIEEFDVLFRVQQTGQEFIDIDSAAGWTDNQYKMDVVSYSDRFRISGL